MAKKKTRRSSQASQQSRRQLRARQLFTNRDEERRQITAFLHAIANAGEVPEKPIFSVYGIGGVGKSTLLTYAWHEFCEQQPDSNIRQVHLDVDSDKAEAFSITEMLWNLRIQIFKETKASLLAFDFIYLKYKEKMNEKVALDDGPLRQFFETVAERSGKFGSLFRGLGTVLEALPVGQIMDASIKFLSSHSKEKELMQLMEIDLNEIDQWRAGDLERKLPGLLAEELGMFLIENNQSVVLVIDGHERLSKKTERAFVEDFLATLLLDEEYSQRAGLILLGRERTNWAVYDDPNDDEHWNTDFISHCHLQGLNKQYADEFLNNSIHFYHDEGKQALVTQLQNHGAAIQQVCRESSADDAAQSYHPFYFDICLETLEIHGPAFQPDRHLGKTPKELMNRFFRYMNQDELALHVALALATDFDWDLVAYLQQKSAIPVFTHAEFLQFSIAHSYVLEAEQQDTFRFNRLMHESLKTYVCTLDEGGKYALRQSVLAGLLEYYDGRLPGAGTVGEHNGLIASRMYARANLVLRCASETGLMNLQDAYARHQVWAERYRGELFSVRVAWDRKWVNMLENHYGFDHPETTQAINGWMNSLQQMLDVGRALLLQK
ncbi:MAG: hypothetical protein Q9M16_08380 [Mariprofundus sp.]|nr:hypothetical protein [Mariprofundus sp.]